MKFLSSLIKSKWGRRIGCTVVVLAVVGLVGGYLILEYYVKQEPFATAKDYSAQVEKHKLTDDVIGQWNYGMSTIESLAYLEKPFFDFGEPYRMEKYDEWCNENRFDAEELDRQGHDFYIDDGYGWPKEMRGQAWRYALEPWAYAMPSIAIIEPQRTREVAYFLGEAAAAHRNPAFWIDYAIYQQWGTPLRDNAMWKGPQLIMEGLYELITGDRERFGAEFQALARHVFATHLENMKTPLGKGHCAGVDCEPNQWFAQ